MPKHQPVEEWRVLAAVWQEGFDAASEHAGELDDHYHGARMDHPGPPPANPYTPSGSSSADVVVNGSGGVVVTRDPEGPS